MTNPITVIGGIIVLAGWFMLLFGVSTDVGFQRDVINIHAAIIAASLIVTGAAIAVAGLVLNIGEASKERRVIAGEVNSQDIASVSNVLVVEDNKERSPIREIWEFLKRP